MKRNRILLLGALAATQAFAAPAMGGSVDPIQAAGIVVTILGGLATIFFIAALIWTSIRGAISDHDHFHKLPTLFFWGGLCAGATGIVYRIAAGS